MGQEITRTRFTEADFEQFPARLAQETVALRSFAKAGGFQDAPYVAGSRSCSASTCGRKRACPYSSSRWNWAALKKSLMPAMLTRDTRVIRQDCLGYLMERIPYAG